MVDGGFNRTSESGNQCIRVFLALLAQLSLDGSHRGKGEQLQLEEQSGLRWYDGRIASISVRQLDSHIAKVSEVRGKAMSRGKQPIHQTLFYKLSRSVTKPLQAVCDSSQMEMQKQEHIPREEPQSSLSCLWKE